MRGHRPRALVLVRRPGHLRRGGGPAHRAARARLPGPGRDGRPGAASGWARWTSCGRTPRTPRTPTSPTAWGARSAAAPRWCCPRRTTARWPRPAPAGCGWSSRASPCRRGSTSRAGSPSGSPSCRRSSCSPAPLPPDLDALADQLDAEAERNQPGHEPFMNPAKALALRLDGHTPLLWGTDAAGRRGRRPRRRARWRPTRAWWPTRTTSAARPQAAGLRRALDLAARGRDIFHDPFADDLGEPAAAPPRLVLLATDDEEPGQVTLRRTGRVWPSTDVLHPVEEVPRGTRHAARAARRGAGLPAGRGGGLPRPGHPHHRTRLSAADAPAAYSPRRPTPIYQIRRRTHRGAAGEPRAPLRLGVAHRDRRAAR